MRLSAVVQIFGVSCHEENGVLLLQDAVTHEYRELTLAENVAVDAQVVYATDLIKANAYKAKRAAEYPPMEEYLDALVKGDMKAQNAYILKCQAVKIKYPKKSKV